MSGFCSSIRPQINRRCLALQTFLGCRPSDYRCKQRSLCPRHGQTGAAHLALASLHNHPSSVHKNKKRTLLQFPIVREPIFYKFCVKFGLLKTFDPLKISIARDTPVILALLTDMVRQGNTKQVQALLANKRISKDSYEWLLKVITLSQKNFRIVSGLVVKESDVVEIAIGYINFPNKRLSKNRGKQNSNFVAVRVPVKVTYVKNFQQRLEEEFRFQQKEGDSLEEKTLKAMQTKAMDMFSADLRAYNLMLVRLFKDHSLETPRTPWVCFSIEYLDKDLKRDFTY